MDEYRCPKCGGLVDLGGASCSKGYLLYKSDSQGIRDKTTPISRALVCLQCGYLELYLDPAKLNQNLGR